MPGLYVHIPFCRSKCGYCDFASYAGKEREIDRYLDALAAEAELYGRLAGRFDTLYIGGGTPSLLSAAQLQRLFSALAPLTGPIGRLAEATFEANPESFDGEKAALLRGAGFNRLSLGLQAAQERLARALGRVAMPADFVKAFQAARVAGFANLSGDLMCGLPGQTMEDFKDSLRFLLDLEPEHFSLYPLEVHEGTPFHAAGIEEAPEAAADMHEFAASRLEKAGFGRYEIASFAKPGREALHNLNYWDGGEYLGLGAAAASHLAGERKTNAAPLEAYCEACLSGREAPSADRETLTGRAKRAERIMLGLRKTAGIELESDIIIEFKAELDRLSAMGLVQIAGRRVSISRDKIYLANAVFREFV